MNAPALAGRWFAYGSEAVDDGRDSDHWYWSFIKVVDLSATDRSKSQWIFDAGLNDGNPYSEDGRGPVQAIALSTTGSLAFIVKDYKTPEAGYRVFSALRTTDPQYQRPAELGYGKTIVPKTLKLAAGAATWMQGGKLTIARLH